MDVTPDSRWTAQQLRQLSAEERDEILRAAAANAEEIYAADKGLTDFEAVGEDDLLDYGHIAE